MRLTREQVEARITKDLPVGSDFDTVRRYLDNQKIEYSWVEEDNTFYSIIRTVNGNFLVKEDVQITIHMDAGKRVSSVAVNSVFTGP